LALIVEGRGELAAAPRLVERILVERVGRTPAILLRPAHRMKRQQMVQPEQLARVVDMQARRVGPGGGILVLLDGDGECAVTLARAVRRLGTQARPDRHVGVVVANREYEAWLAAGARSLRGRRGLPDDLEPPSEPDALVNPKGWLSHRMVERYDAMVDQPALTEAVDLEEASGSRSFRKLLREVERLVSALGTPPCASDSATSPSTITSRVRRPSTPRRKPR
jgi:hypothetical protein